MAQSYTKITIRPYVEKKKFNLGLENHGQVLFENTHHVAEMAALQVGDTIRYLTGLDPTAPEVENIKDEELRELRLKRIKEILIKAELKVGGRRIDPADEDWYNKIVRLRPDNIEFWSSAQMKLTLDNNPLDLSINTNIIDLLKYESIKAGGFPEVALSLQDAIDAQVTPKFYLDELEATMSVRTSLSKARNKAGATLTKLYEKEQTKLLYVAKVIDPISTQYKKTTPLDILYANMDDFIQGQGAEKNQEKAINLFARAADLDLATLKLKAIVKDALSLRYIGSRADGMMQEMSTGSALGRTVDEVVMFLSKPESEDIHNRIADKVEESWI